MQDPGLRRSRRAGCAGLIQCCRVHEWSWNAPSSFSKHQRAVAPPSFSGRLSAPKAVVSVRHVSALLSLFYVASSFGIRGAARRTSLPFFRTIRAIPHGPTPARAQRLRSRSTRAVAVVVVVAHRSWRRVSLRAATRPKGPKVLNRLYDRRCRLPIVLVG
jgi:hypothetical protein